MIKQFSEIGKTDVLTAGGKGANLGEMTRAGLDVPSGFVITSDAYRYFLSENGLADEIDSLLRNAGDSEEALTSAAEKIRGMLLSAKLPETLRASIEAAYKSLSETCGNRVAVRSSATAEDLPDASFAGQQETYLNVTDISGLYDSVIKCYASLWGNRAVSYRRSQGYDQRTVALAVVVQQMVESEKSGVLFTANPVNNDRSEIQLNASYGLGEAVVSGKVTADSFICTKDGAIKNSVMGSKKIQIVYDEAGTKEIPVPDEMRSSFCITDEEVRKLCAEAVRVEDYYGCPMDIEWAIRGGNVYILQARAITTLGTEIDNSRVEEYVSAFEVSKKSRNYYIFLLEKMPFVYYPLDIDLCIAINGQKAKIMSEVGIDTPVDPVMNDDGIMMFSSQKKKINGRIFRIGGMMKELKNLPACDEKINRAIFEAEKVIDRIAGLDIDNLTLSECGEAISSAYSMVDGLAYARFKYAVFPGMLGMGKIKKVLKKISPDLSGYDLYSNLDNKTAVVTRDIVALSEKIGGDEELKNAVLSGRKYKDILCDFPDISEAFSEFMKADGMKSDFNTYCIFGRTFIEDPDRLLGIIRPLLTSRPQPDQQRFEPLMEQLKSVCGERKYAELRTDIDYIRSFHVKREESQYMFETMFYYLRRVLARTALLLTGNSDPSENIAFLFTNELVEACRSGGLSSEQLEKISRRKANRPLAEKVWESYKSKLFGSSGDVMSGVSGSVGEYTGRVCIVRSPAEFHKLQKGDVLVCPYTDPEWTPLFKVAGAVVADTGAALSHAAIVAREYGIPAVLGVGSATTKFADGDMICVNGTSGEVTKVDL